MILSEQFALFGKENVLRKPTYQYHIQVICHLKKKKKRIILISNERL